MKKIGTVAGFVILLLLTGCGGGRAVYSSRAYPDPYYNHYGYYDHTGYYSRYGYPGYSPIYRRYDRDDYNRGYARGWDHDDHREHGEHHEHDHH